MNSNPDGDRTEPHPRDMYPRDTYPMDMFPPGHLPTGHLPPGHLPPGHIPPRTYTPQDIYPSDFKLPYLVHASYIYFAEIAFICDVGAIKLTDIYSVRKG